LARSEEKLAHCDLAVGRHSRRIVIQSIDPAKRSRLMTKSILITGAGSGFGKLAAFDLARKGHHVIATAHIWPQVTELKREAQTQGLSLQADKLDVTSAFDRHNALKWDVDVLVNNAGVLEAGPIAEQPLELLRAMFDVNFFCNLEIAQGFARKMVAKRSGKIVFTSSMGGLWTVPYGAGYCATKHALEAIAEGLKTELAPFGVKVATINPGIFGTGFNDRGADSLFHWYDPNKHFTPPEAFAGFAEMLTNQLDPESMAAVIVDVVLSDNGRFRNVYPREVEAMIKQRQADAWQAVS
jgi:short-subunit dehydrogenase